MNENDSVIAIKVFTIIFLFLISVLLGILPAKWEKFRKSPKLVGFANSFAAGLFLGVGVFHILPEGVADYAKYRKEKGLPYSDYPDQSFPLIFFCAVLGYCAILFLDKVAFSSHEFFESKGGHPEYKDLPGAPLEPVESVDGANHLFIDDSEIFFHKDHQHAFAIDEIEEFPDQEVQVDKDELALKAILSSTMRIGREVTKSMRSPKHDDYCTFSVNTDPTAHPDLEISKKNTHESEGRKKLAGFRPYILLIALSLHAVFEGIAIGLENELGPTLNLAAAVMIHKWAEALTLGISLLKAHASSTTLVSMIVLFAASSPLGIIFGWIILSAPLIVSAIFKAIATGTFLYLSATEIAVEEFSITKNRFSKFVCYMIGVTFIALATYAEA